MQQAGPALKQLEKLAGRQGLGEQIALHLIAPIAPQELKLAVRLYAFGNDLEAQAFGERDDRLGNRRIVRVGGDSWMKD